MVLLVQPQLRLKVRDAVAELDLHRFLADVCGFSERARPQIRSNRSKSQFGQSSTAHEYLYPKNESPGSRRMFGFQSMTQGTVTATRL